MRNAGASEFAMAQASTPERQRAKSRIELLAEKQGQLPKFQRKLYGPTSLSGVQTLVNSPNELCNFLLSTVPEDMVFQAEIFHKHSFLEERKVVLMIRVDSDEFQSRGTHIPILVATKKRKSGSLNFHMNLPGKLNPSLLDFVPSSVPPRLANTTSLRVQMGAFWESFERR